jgi:Family of unknown function (DUF5988)
MIASLQPDFGRCVVNETDLTSTAVQRAVLEGGPADLPEGDRQGWIEADEYRIKVPYGGGYEHYERTGVSHVYRWVARTKVAE